MDGLEVAASRLDRDLRELCLSRATKDVFTRGHPLQGV